MTGLPTIIYHICERKDWEAAQEIGAYRADSLESEGFIHCSREDQVAEVADFIFKGMDNLVLLHIAVDKLQAEFAGKKSKEIYSHTSTALSTWMP